MKKLFLVCIAAVLTLTSCESKSEKRVSKNNSKEINHSDSLFFLTDLDREVRKLKNLPEFKNTIFLSPKESQKYLKILISKQESFKEEIIYRSESDSEGGSIECTLKITIDTVQSFRPIAKWTNTMTFYDKGKYQDTSHYSLQVYYLPTLKIMYVKNFSSSGKELNQHLEFFSQSIESGFKL
jgi:hypothetical protein